MKQTIAIILSVIMLVMTLVSCGGADTSSDASSKVSSAASQGAASSESSEPASNGSNPANTASSGPVSSEEPANSSAASSGSSGNSEIVSIFTPVNVANSEKKEHQTLEELPVRATLVGSDTLPAIDNQGGVGCCASNAIAYMQFTNAVAQYQKSIGKLTIDVQNYSDCFSPKYTFQYAGASTSNVYNFLMEHGCLTNKVDAFAKDAGGGSILTDKKTMRWIVSEGAQIGGLSYRLSGYEQTFVTNNPLYTASGKSGVAMTTSEAGRAMIQKIKEAIATGNVVVTGGYPSSWVDTRMPVQAGTLVKSGDKVITYATNVREGGHQVCIVAYDDEITVKANGIEMKGAFLIANSWGTSYGKDGYIWIMYDALNSESEFEAFSPSGTHKNDVRDWALDQFCFIYWDRDIVAEKPELYAEVEIKTADREKFSVSVSRTDANGQTTTSKPYMFDYAGARPGYETGSDYLNTSGTKNGNATTAYFAVPFDRLLVNIPEGASYADYTWSIKISSESSDSPVTVSSLKLFSKNQKLYAFDLGSEGEVLSKSSRTYTFDFGSASGISIYSGSYKVQHVGTGNFLVKDQVMTFKGGEAKNALDFHMVFDSETNTYKLWRYDDKYVVDAMIKNGVFEEGAEVRFNANNATRNNSQQWRVSYNQDGTVSFYLVSDDAEYALSFVNGATVLVKATELNDSIKWKLTPSEQPDTSVSSKKTENGLEVSGTVRKSSTASVTLTVTKADGTAVTTSDVAVSSKAFSSVLPITEAGTYIIRITNTESGDPECACYMIVVK